MKLVLTSVFTLLFLIGFSQVTNVQYIVEESDQENHNHVHVGDHEKELTKEEMLVNFNYAEARAEFDKLGYDEEEYSGWLKGKEYAYLKIHHPEFFKPYEMPKNYKPNGIYVPGKNLGCPNAGFEDLTFGPQWQGGVGIMSSGANPPYTNTTIQSNGLNAAYNDPAAQHTLMTIPPGSNVPGSLVGYDPVAINSVTGLAEIPFLAPFGGNVSVRLGNEHDQYYKERLLYTLTVSPSNKAFYYQYAVILQLATSHTVVGQPQFTVKLYDAAGADIPGFCGTYNVISNNAQSDPTFTASTTTGVYYKKWTRVNVDLSAYIGQTITLEFETRDCNQGAHFGYAYVDAGCLEDIEASIDYCQGDVAAQLTAVAGAQYYQWFGPNSNVPIAGATNDTLIVPSPTFGDTFYVNFGELGGCVITKTIVINYSQLNLEESFITPTCYGGPFGSAQFISSGSQSGYNYTWSGNSSGSNSTGLITDLTPGTYNLNISSNNPNCSDTNTTFTIPVSPFLVPDQVNVSFCEGEALINGPTSTDYIWYDDNQNSIGAPFVLDSLVFDSTAFQGENYYLLYELPNGCYDSIIYTLVDRKVPSDFTLSQPFQCRSIGILFNDLTPLSDSVHFNVQGPNGFDVTYFDTIGNQFNFINLDTGTYIVRVIDEGCFYDTSFTITDLSDTNYLYFNFCPNDPYNLQSLSTGVHQWYNPLGDPIGGNTQTIIIQNIIEGPYIDSCLVSPGCYFVSTYYMDSIYLTAAYSIDQPDCYGGNDGSIFGSIVTGIPGTPSFTATGPNGYVSNNANPMVNVSAGTYYITAQILACTKTDTVVVGQPLLPTDTLTIYTETCNDLDQGVLYAPEGFLNYQWYYNGFTIANQNADSIVVLLPTDIFAYSVTYTSPVDGCTKVTSQLSAEAFTFAYQPTDFNNVFSPNGDDANALYYPVHDLNLTIQEIADLAGDYKLSIFNRWGNKIFETTNYLVGWDGTNKGTPVEDGTYFAEIEYRTKCTANEPIKLVQVVQVVR